MSFSASETASHKLGLFGIPSDKESAQLILLPVTWDVTTSYSAGAAKGPQAILEASPQLDLFDFELGRIYEPGLYMEPISEELFQQNAAARELAEQVIDDLEDAGRLSAESEKNQERINEACQQMVDLVYEKSKQILKDKKLLGIIGGDHSTPYGAVKAIAEAYEGNFGILHIDAHADLREHYQGFTYSHASIMNNIMKLPKAPKKLVQVGIRDFSEEEKNFADQSEGRIEVVFDLAIKRQLFEGNSWKQICENIVRSLPENVYVSFDVDGLSPEFCPNTGTPVPGGLSFDQAVYLISTLGRSGRRIIGFDLNEVAPAADLNNQWDGNVGARLVYKLCGWCFATNNLLKPLT